MEAAEGPESRESEKKRAQRALTQPGIKRASTALAGALFGISTWLGSKRCAGAGEALDAPPDCWVAGSLRSREPGISLSVVLLFCFYSFLLPSSALSVVPAQARLMCASRLQLQLV